MKFIQTIPSPKRTELYLELYSFVNILSHSHFCNSTLTRRKQMWLSKGLQQKLNKLKCQLKLFKRIKHNIFMENYILKFIFTMRRTVLSNLLITRNAIHRGMGGFSRPRWSIDWWCGLPDFGRNVIIDHLSRWGVCRGWAMRGAGVGGFVGGFHEGARRRRRRQSESWHPSTRQPPRHRDTGTTTHLSALLPLPPRILFRFHCPECVTSRQPGGSQSVSSVVARPPKSTEQ